MLSLEVRQSYYSYLSVLKNRRKRLYEIAGQLKKAVSRDEFLALYQLIQKLDEMISRQINTVNGQL